ncbi:MAG: YetF domain-containing protein [Anaerolineaceae bacterium]
MFDLGTDWWEIVLRSAVVYGALLVGLRLTGKRQIGQMAPFDLVVILLIANAVQNAMVGPDTSLLGGLISAGVLLGANIVVARSRDRIPGLRRAVEGQPAILVSGGKVIAKAIAEEQIDMDELEQAIREHGIEKLEDVRMAVLEVDGTISIVPMGVETIRTHRRFRQQHHQN